MPYLARTITAANGVQTAFPISFPFLARTDVFVFVHAAGAALGASKVVGVDFDWTSNGLITFRAGHVPANGQLVDIRRVTKVTALANSLQAGGTMSASKLSQNDTQLLYLAQEEEDVGTDLQDQLDDDATSLLALTAADAAETANRIAGDAALQVQITNLDNVEGSPTALTRAALAALNPTVGTAILTEGDRSGIFDYKAGDYSAAVAADPNQGIFVAASGGAWVRRIGIMAVALWFGVATTATAAENTARFNSALETLRVMRVTGHGYGRGASIGLYTPAGNYQFNAELQIKHALSIVGDYNGMGADGTNFIWTVNNTHGFHAMKDDGVSVNAHGFRLKGFNLSNSAFVSTIGEYHAVFQNSKGIIEDIFCVNWPGDGVYSFGDTGTDGSNCNGCIWRNIQAQSCRWTLRIAGGDNNGGASEMISAIGNRAGVTFDYSFLGNGHFGGWAETCGTVTGFHTRCSSGGHVYEVAFGQEAWCSANPPTGTTASNQGWLYLTDDAVQPYQPTWTAAQTWYWSSPFSSSPGSAANAARFHDVYIEGNCNRCVLSDAGSISIVDPLAAALWPITATGARHAGYAHATNGIFWTIPANLDVKGYIQADGVNNHIGPQAGGAADTDLTLDNTNTYSSVTFRSWAAGVSHQDGYVKTQSLIGITVEGKQTVVIRTTDDGEIAQFIDGWLYLSQLGVNHVGTLKVNGGTGVKLQYNGVDQLTIGNGTATFAGTVAASNLSGTNTGDQFSAIAQATLVGRAAGAGAGVASALTAAQAKTLLALAPADVTFAGANKLLGVSIAGAGIELGLAGGLSINTGNLTVAGGAIAPASVAATGAITSSGGGMGYATGAGGTVVQATSKATGVTLNKFSGQITMNAAALAAGTIVSFVLTNSQIAATDLLVLNHVSGGTPGSYSLNARCAAGSATIDVRNNSAASLSEAIVIGFAVQKAVTA
jgi:hypothetical protein